MDGQTTEPRATAKVLPDPDIKELQALDLGPWATATRFGGLPESSSPETSVMTVPTPAGEKPADGAARTGTRNEGNMPKTPKKTAPESETDMEHTDKPKLGDRLRFKDGKLWFGDGDAPSRTVYEATADRLRRAAELDVSRLQPFYETVIRETTDTEADTDTDMDRVYCMKLTSPPVSPDDGDEPQPCPEDAAEDARMDILYGSGFACAASGPWKNCQRLLEYIDYDRDTGEIKFTAPFFSELVIGMRRPDAEAADEPAKEREDGTAKGYRITETAIHRARNLTPTKLRRITPDRFQFVQKAADGTVIFAGPLPPPYDEGLTCTTADDGSIRVSEDEFHRFEDAWEKYALTLPECRRRTEANAGKMTTLVDDIAIITDKLYRHALTPIQNGTAFLMPVGMADALGIGNGESGVDEFTFSLEKCKPEDIDKLDFVLLATVYSIILNQLDQRLKEAECPDDVLRILEDPNLDYVVQLFIPSFLEMIGSKPDVNENIFAVARNKLESFKDVDGIHVTKDQFGMQYERYSVMRWISDDHRTNTVRFSSPYCNHIARLLLHKHLKRDKKGNLQMPPGGPPAMTVSHSYAIRPVLASERNKAAAEIVCYVAYLVETASRAGGVPRASARTIIKECPKLQLRITNAKSTSDQNKYLKRAFERAWKILADPKYSSLAENHEDFQIPTWIPKMRELDKTIYFSTKTKNTKASKTANRKIGS